MSETAEQLKVELAQLSTRERAELASFLIHSLDEEVDDQAEVAWSDELTRRMQEINHGTAMGEPAEQVLKELREKYQ
jgi:putative addiction module component (TIGR02574 family)